MTEARRQMPPKPASYDSQRMIALAFGEHPGAVSSEEGPAVGIANGCIAEEASVWADAVMGVSGFADVDVVGATHQMGQLMYEDARPILVTVDRPAGACLYQLLYQSGTMIRTPSAGTNRLYSDPSRLGLSATTF